MPPGRMDHIMDKRTKLTVRGRTRTVEEWARWRGMTEKIHAPRFSAGVQGQDA